MKKRIPLGKREGQTLEFKSARALEKPGSIAREVVSILNAKRGKGEIWIGLLEQDGVATREENVLNAERARNDLLNSLLERIDPEPRSEVDVKVIRGESVQHLILVEADPGQKRGPYALKGESLLFLTRVGHRVRAMTREEIFGTTANEDPHRAALDALAVRRKAVLERKESRLWIAVQPSPLTSIDLQGPALSELLKDPTQAGNRRSGWTYGPSEEGPRLNGRAKPTARLEIRDYKGREVSIARDGCVEFSVPLQWIEFRKLQIHTLGLLEYIVSTVRLTRAAYQACEIQPEGVFLEAVLTGTDGWTIPQYSPGSWGYENRDSGRDRKVEDVVFATPLSFPTSELIENPDRLGFRLVREIYEHFGLTEDRIPPQYDRSLERLILND